MEKVNNTIKIYVQIITFLLIWGVVILAFEKYTPLDLWLAIKRIPLAISVYAFFGFVFIKWLWRWDLLQGWLIRVPDLQGTWRGELKSDWIDPITGKGIEPIPIVLVIKQTFSDIKCISMTKESTSYSTTAAFNSIHGTDDLYLTYNYTNRPLTTIRERSAIHDGAAILKIIKKPRQSLKGEYWTNRKTKGEMTLYFDSKNLVEEF
ncbi:hypothetical protein BAC3_00603 [uncultured bacterium]|nr:hypothetical protein BAC3_00603 [uncultured bacterium]